MSRLIVEVGIPDHDDVTDRGADCGSPNASLIQLTS